MLYLAALLAQRAMYLGDRHARKGVFIDEAWRLSTFTTGRRFIERAGRDSRKHNTRVLSGKSEPVRPAAAGPGEPRVGSAHRSAHRREGAGGRAAVHPGHPAEAYEAVFESLSGPTAIGSRGAREFVFSDVVVSIDGALSGSLGYWRQANAGVQPMVLQRLRPRSGPRPPRRVRPVLAVR